MAIGSKNERATFSGVELVLIAVANQRLYQQVAEQIKRMIEVGQIRTGDRLPAERELAGMLNVSRATVREAMIALEIAGLIEIRMGSGIYVCDDASTGHASAPDASPDGEAFGFFEILDARLIVEPQIAAEAARNAQSEDIALMRQSIEKLGGAFDYRTRIEEDQRLHFAIARASGNVILARIVEDLWRHMFDPMYSAISLFHEVMDTLGPDVAAHREIVRQIERRRPASARRAMREHLQQVQSMLNKASAGRSPD